jgi:hypothetical protein
LIRLAVFLASGDAYMKLHETQYAFNRDLSLYFVGWVEPTPGLVGFRYTLPNLHFAGFVAKCETQQRPET